MPFQPADTLRNRTFVGLLVAQFLAAFNDQAIHAAAMFFALHRATLTAPQAIALMPILFYAPWAIFCTLAGYFADRYSKQRSLIGWKVAEVGITLVALLGFYLGSVHGSPWGPRVVLATVFLMGMHSAFFVPAKYGAMPEILAPQLLSRGNGLLESLSFLAVILGTVAGGVLSDHFHNREWVIGVVLTALAVVGAAASLLIEYIPPANPTRAFPRSIYGPLWGSLRTLFGAQPLRLAVVGLAFFTFVVAFMRATVYLLGETQNPHWPESKTSLIVGMSALGIGLGSPLAGWLSGRKVELGLVPLGGVGMVAGTLTAAFVLRSLTGGPMLVALIACIILIGFCTGFYIVPLYTLLQHRAPKTSKGDSIAVSNFINVTGAILASLVMAGVVYAAHKVGLAPVVAQVGYASGSLIRIDQADGDVTYCEIEDESQPVGSVERIKRIGTPDPAKPKPVPDADDEMIADRRRAEFKLAINVSEGDEVEVSRYELRGVPHFQVRAAGDPLAPAHDDERLPRFLFVGAGVVTLVTLATLVAVMPDLLARALYVVSTFRQSKLRVHGTHHVPASGPVLLATNCQTPAERHAVQLATDRSVRFFDANPTAVAAHLTAGGVAALAGPYLTLLPEVAGTYLVVPVYFGRVPSHAGRPDEPGAAFGPPLADHADLETVRKAIAAAPTVADDH